LTATVAPSKIFSSTLPQRIIRQRTDNRFWLPCIFLPEALAPVRPRSRRGSATRRAALIAPHDTRPSKTGAPRLRQLPRLTWKLECPLTHLHQHCVAVGHSALLRRRSKLYKILRQGELGRTTFDTTGRRGIQISIPKWPPCCTSTKEVEIAKEYRRGATSRQMGMVTISYDEKPGIQALAI
jgi:hypothetical protein